MDFRQTIQPNHRPAPASPQPAVSANDDNGVRNKYNDEPSHVPFGKWVRLFTLVMLAGIVVLLAAIAYGVGHSPSNQEFKYVDQSKYQAVFLNSGQVYFGNVTALNDKYVRLTDVYYLTQASSDGTSSSASSSSNYTLVKLGCQQIHDPYDAMLINRQEMSFWENIQDNGTVMKKIKEFKQQYPNGPDCSNVSTQTQATNTNTQGGTGTSTGTGASTGTGTGTSGK